MAGVGMAEVLSPALAAEAVGGGSSLALFVLVAVVVLAFLGAKVLGALIGVLSQLVVVIAGIFGTLVGALLFVGVSSVEATAPPPPPVEPVPVGVPIWVYLLGLAGLGMLLAVGLSLAGSVRRNERELGPDPGPGPGPVRRPTPTTPTTPTPVPAGAHHPTVPLSYGRPVPERVPSASRPASEIPPPRPVPGRPRRRRRDRRGGHELPGNARESRRGPRRRRHRRS